MPENMTMEGLMLTVGIILAAETLVAVEDLYRPYRPKRRTRATIAKEKGLEPLAALDHIVEDKGTA